MMSNLYALNTNTYHYFTLNDAIKAAKFVGFNNIELAAVQGWTEHISADMSKLQLEQLENILADEGIEICAISGHCDLCNKERISDFKANIRLTHRLGCKTIISSTGEAHFSTETQDKKKLLCGINEVLNECEKYGITLAIETHGQYGSGERLVEIMEHFNSPLLGITYDTANVVRHGGVMPQHDLKTCAKYVRHVHLKDKAGLHNDRIFPALGHGWIDFESVFDILDSVEYCGAYSLEIEYFEDVVPKKARIDRDVSESYRYLIEAGRIAST